jgi:hypothetical protein
MKTPRLWPAILVVAALLSAAALLVFAIFSLPAPAQGSNLRAWNVHFLLWIVAVIPVGISILILTRALQRRYDEAFAKSRESAVTLAVSFDAPTRDYLRSSAQASGSRLPWRALILAVSDGLEVWTRPGRTRQLTVSWAEIAGVYPTQFEVGGGFFEGILIKMIGERPAMQMALDGPGLLGNQSREFAVEAAKKLDTLARS